MKLYYYESATWTEITGITHYPTCMKRINNPSSCSVEVIDFEGALFVAWEARDYTPMKVTNDSGTIIFQGYLTGKTFKAHSVTFNLVGFGSVLDWTPFNKDYLFQRGKVKSVPYALGEDATEALHANNGNVAGCCFDGTNFYVCDVADTGVYKYTAAWVYVAFYDVSANVTTPRDICFDGTYFYIVDLTNDDVSRYNSAFVFQATVMDTLTNTIGITYHDGTFYVLDINDNTVHSYTSAWVHVTSYDIDADVSDPICLEVFNNQFYITDNTDEKIHIFDMNWDLVESIAFATHPIAICTDKVYFYIINATAVVYRYFTFMVPYDVKYAIELMEEDEDVFAWDNSYWINNRDVGIVISDTLNPTGTTKFDCSAIGLTDCTLLQGDHESVQVVDDDLLHSVKESSATIDGVIAYTMDTAGLADTNTLKSLTVKFRWGLYAVSGLAGTPYTVRGTMYLKKDADPLAEIISTGYIKGQPTMDRTRWVEGEFEITEDIANYLDKTGANYTSLKGLKIVLTGTLVGANTYIKIHTDFLEVDVEYYNTVVSPIMESIIGNGDVFVLCERDWSTSGVDTTNAFVIGQNTNDILAEIMSKTQLDYIVLSTLTKYMPRKFSGNNCMEALKSICLLEGLQWAEDHLNKRIVLSRVADFEDSTIDLTAANYDDVWEYEDNCNHVKEVIVHGNASLNISYIAESTTSNSLLSKQITDDTIMTIPDAQEVADTQLAIYEIKQPSIKIILHAQLYTLEALQTVGLTMVRPTVAATDYVVRRIDVSRFGYDSGGNEIIKTTLYCGLGSTPEEEKMGNIIRDLQFKTHKAFTDRLINTPLGAGATITSTDITDFTSAVQALSINNVVEDTSPELGGNLEGGVYDILQPYCAIQKASAQSINNNSVTLVLFGAGDNEISDVLAMHNPAANTSRITIPASRGGLYLIEALWSWANNATGRRILNILLNGNVIYNHESAVTAYTVNNLAMIYLLAPGDYVEMRVYQSSGGALANLNIAGYNVFKVMKIGDVET